MFEDADEDIIKKTSTSSLYGRGLRRRVSGG